MKTNRVITIIGFSIFTICLLIIFFSPDIINSNYWSEKWHQNSFDDVKHFIDHGYEEIKTISIRFLTLLTAILVFSITFSEKVVSFDTAESRIKWILILGWICFVTAITLDGIGIALNVYALASALYDQTINEVIGNFESISYLDFTVRALVSMILGGMFFVLGLVLIVYSGILSLQKKA